MNFKETVKHRKVILNIILIISMLSVSACTSREDKANAFYENGMRLLEIGEFNKANIEFRNALQLNQSLTKAIWGQALVAEKQGELRRLYKLLNTIVEIDGEHIKAIVKLGRLLLIAGQLDKALNMSEKALQVDEYNLSVMTFRAAVLLKLNDYDSAVNLANKVLEIDPVDIDALIILATERIVANDPVKALEYLDRGLEKSKKNIPLQLIKVNALEDLKKNDQAEEVLKKLAYYYPDVPVFNDTLIKFYLKNNQTGKAENILQDGVNKNPHNIKAKKKLIRFLSATKGVEAARKKLETFSKQNPSNQDIKFLLVHFYINNKYKKRGYELLENIISHSDEIEKSHKAMNIKAGLLLEDGDKSEAETLVNNILSKDEYNNTALIIKASIFIDRQQYDDAIALLRIVLKDNPKSSSAAYYIAKAYDLSGSHELADKQYYTAFKTSKYNLSYGISYVKYLLKNNMFNKAEKILIDILNISPNNTMAMKMLAQTRLSNGDLIGAQRVADELKKRENTISVAQQIESTVLASMKKYDESIALLKKSYRESQNNTGPVFALVKTYLLSGNEKEAHDFLDSLIKVNPRNINAILLKGNVYTAQGNIDLAIKHYSQVITYAPDNPSGYYYLAISYIRKADLKKASEILNEGLLLLPKSFVLRMAKAHLHEINSDYDNAIKIYEVLLNEKPGSDMVANNLASLLTEHKTDNKSYKKAYVLAKRFKKSDIAHFSDTYGWASYRNGNYIEASIALGRAVEKSPGNPIFHYHLGMNYLALEKNNMARDHFKYALDTAGEKPFIKRNEINELLKNM